MNIIQKLFRRLHHISRIAEMKWRRIMAARNETYGEGDIVRN